MALSQNKNQSGFSILAHASHLGGGYQLGKGGKGNLVIWEGRLCTNLLEEVVDPTQLCDLFLAI